MLTAGKVQGVIPNPCGACSLEKPAACDGCFTRILSRPRPPGVGRIVLTLSASRPGQEDEVVSVEVYDEPAIVEAVLHGFRKALTP